VLQAVACPNPQRGPLWGLALDLSAPADLVRLKVYTEALVLVAHPELFAARPAGWSRASFSVPGLPDGLYYVKAQAESQGRASAWSRAAKLVRLP
jgi:hypothetical protein